MQNQKKKSLTVEGKTYSVSKAKEFQGVIIPVGGTVKVFLPVHWKQEKNMISILPLKPIIFSYQSRKNS
jgi:hypothetical protein